MVVRSPLLSPGHRVPEQRWVRPSGGEGEDWVRGRVGALGEDAALEGGSAGAGGREAVLWGEVAPARGEEAALEGGVAWGFFSS